MSDTVYRIYTRRIRPDKFGSILSLVSMDKAKELLKQNGIEVTENDFIHKAKFTGGFASQNAAELVVKTTLELEKQRTKTEAERKFRNRIYFGVGTTVFASLLGGGIYGLTKFLRKNK